MNKINLEICKTQGDLFKYIAKNKYDFSEFVNKYMNSDFCNREMDSNYSRFHFEFPEECLDFFNLEIKLDIFNDYYINEEDAYEIGFLYRYLSFLNHESSKLTIKKYPFEKVYNLIKNYRDSDIKDIIDLLNK